MSEIDESVEETPIDEVEQPEVEQPVEAAEEPAVEEAPEVAEEPATEEVAAEEPAAEEELHAPLGSEAADYAAVRKKRKRGGKVGKIVAGVVVVAVVACAAVLGVDDMNRTKIAPANTTLDGITDISGMNAAEIEAVAEEHIAADEVNGISLAAGDEIVEIRTSACGSADAEGTAAAALSLYGDNIFERCVERIGEVVFKKDFGAHDVSTAFILDESRVRQQVVALDEELPDEPQSAGYEVDEENRQLVVKDAKQGIVLDIDATVAAIMEAAANYDGETTIVQATADIVEPENNDYGAAIYVDTQTCHLQYFVDGELVKDYPCTPGMPGYSTPKGDFYISTKDAAPSWYNPHSAWSENMPESIGPGPGNPLGLRALGVSCGGGIFVHGTTKYWQLGSVGSHGCIRLGNDDVVEFFDMVELDTPIFIR